MPLNTSSFRSWAGTDQPALEGYDLIDHCWTTPGPVLVRAFHGTTHKFENFSLERSTHQGQFGKVHYFTSCAYDAETNYANKAGPDLLVRVNQRTEELQDIISDIPEDYGLSDDPIFEEINSLAEDLARDELIGSTPRVLDVYLRLNKPFVIDAANQTHINAFDNHADFNDVVKTFAKDNNLPFQSIKDDWSDHEEEIYELYDMAVAELQDTMQQAFNMAAEDLECLRPPELPDFQYPITENSCADIEKTFRESEGVSYVDNTDGENVSSSLLSLFLENLGFDSIILLNAERRFQTMNMGSGTTHIHLMKSAHDQIRIVGTYDD